MESDQQQQFDLILTNLWKELYQKQQNIFRSGFDNVQKKVIQNGYLVMLNKDLIAKKKNKQFTNQDEKEQYVFLDFDEQKFNFNKVNPQEILFYINLEEEEIVTKEKFQKLQLDLQQKETEEDYFDNEQQIKQSLHPVLINISPICQNHCIIPMFPQEQLPQVIGQEMLLLILNIFRICKLPTIRIGYNSIGAYSTVNHLHFQLIFVNDLFPQELSLPIERFQKKQFFQTTLQNPKDQFQMYTAGVIFQELIDYPIKTICLTPLSKNDDMGEIHNSLSFVAGTITNTLLDKCIPHNIIISDLGQQIYIIPRQFEKNCSDIEQCLKPAFLEISGVALCQNEQYYETINAEKYESDLEKYVSLNKKEFEDLKITIINIFSKQYK